VLRLVLSPRWLAWHVLTLGAMVTCGFLSAWQWHRAGSAMGSAVNVGYGLQWPVFAVFFGYIWWRMLRIEIAKLPAGPVAEPVPEVPPEPSPFAYRARRVGPVDEAENPALAEYNRMLAALAAQDLAAQDHDQELREQQRQEGR
jgi:DNA-binding transcriptional regulator of glucitol operon